MATIQVKEGECDVCGKDAPLSLHHNIWYCGTCWSEELYHIEERRQLSERKLTATEQIANAIKIDESIEVKTDIFNAATVPAIELKDLVWQDDTIPADQKEYRYTQLMAERIDKLKARIFDKEQELGKDKNELKMWVVQVQNQVSTLRAELRAEFKKYSIDYEPKAPKSAKPAAPRKDKKVDVNELKRISAEFKVPEVVVRMTQIRRNLTVKEAAEIVAREMGLIN